MSFGPAQRLRREVNVMEQSGPTLVFAPKPSAEELYGITIAQAQRREALARARDHRRSWQQGLFAAGRVFLGLVFAGAAAEKVLDYSGTLAALQDTALDVHWLLPVAVVVELAGGVLLAIGFQTRVAAAALAGYLVLAMLMVHPDLGFDFGRAVAYANLGLLSALAMVVGHGGGTLSLDHVLVRRRKARRSAIS